MVSAAAPGAGADREEAAPDAGEEIVVRCLLAPLLDMSNDEEAVVVLVATPSPGADREEAAPGAGEEIVVPGLLAPPPLLLVPSSPECCAFCPK